MEYNISVSTADLVLYRNNEIKERGNALIQLTSGNSVRCACVENMPKIRKLTGRKRRRLQTKSKGKSMLNKFEIKWGEESTLPGL